jgi:hypothetical protein
MDFAAEKIVMGQDFFDRILLVEGLAHIAENIFNQLDGETLAICGLVCKSWQQFLINNGVKLWKRQYLQKLAKPGTDAHRLIKSNPKLFQFDQADQGTFHTCARGQGGGGGKLPLHSGLGPGHIYFRFYFLVSKPNWAISKYSRVIFVVFSNNFSENLSKLKFKKTNNFSTVFPVFRP